MLLNVCFYHCITSFCLMCALSSLTASVLAAPQWYAPLHKPVHEITFHVDIPNPARVAKAQQIETFKMDGLTGNRAHIPEMVEALKESQPIEKQYTAWLALSRLGATEAVPAMNAALKLVYYSPNYMRGEFARACRARLLAETEATPHAMAVRFFREAGQTPEQINNAALNTMHEIQDAPRTHVTPKDIYKERRSVELLVDMIYHGPATALLADPLVKRVDFRLWSGADHKLLLAPLTPDQQRQKLVDTLANSSEINDTFDCGQLLIDLGRPEAIKLMTAKLQDVLQDQAMYPPGANMKLSLALSTAGDTSQKNLYGIDKFEIHQFRYDY